jgi:hypothetical protein
MQTGPIASTRPPFFARPGRASVPVQEAHAGVPPVTVWQPASEMARMEGIYSYAPRRS